MQQEGLAAFEKIGEDVAETVERRPASLVVVRTRRPKFVRKDRERLAETEVLQGALVELPIARGLAGPGLLADTVMRRWYVVFDHLYRKGDIVEVGCWSHARRYFYKALETDPDRARHALALIAGIFVIERELAQAPPETRLTIRQTETKPSSRG